MKAAGIDMLPAAAGIPVIRRELTGERSTREQVVGLALGILGAGIADAGGLDRDVINVRPRATLAAPRSQSIDSTGWPRRSSVTLDPRAEPFLDHHRIDGPAVLPGVMGIEAFATTARLAFPDHHVLDIETIDFAAPLKFYRDDPRRDPGRRPLRARRRQHRSRCQLIGSRKLANQDEPQITVHFEGRVLLGADPSPLESVKVPSGSPQAEEVGGRRGHLPDLLPRARLPGPRPGVASRQAGRGNDGCRSSRRRVGRVRRRPPSTPV